ncbi:MAG: hypothetical protein KAH77_12050 [Thiomargarita sp.]|nr:hypothetical protein [Thiomargarita sp.]
MTQEFKVFGKCNIYPHGLLRIKAVTMGLCTVLETIQCENSEFIACSPHHAFNMPDKHYNPNCTHYLGNKGVTVLLSKAKDPDVRILSLLHTDTWCWMWSFVTASTVENVLREVDLLTSRFDFEREDLPYLSELELSKLHGELTKFLEAVG